MAIQKTTVSPPNTRKREKKVPMKKNPHPNDQE
jgi:hypothetical protein